MRQGERRNEITNVFDDRSTAPRELGKIKVSGKADYPEELRKSMPTGMDFLLLIFFIAVFIARQGKFNFVLFLPVHRATC